MIATLPTPKTTYSLNILLVEDSEDDFELCLHALKNEFTPRALRVDTEAGFRAALATSEWDAILCDYTLPQFSVFEALHIVQELGIDIPFIVVSGSISEEDAVHCIKSGAHDYLIKDRLLKLPHAILREIREARGREEYRWQEKVNQQLFKELKNYITAINTSTLTTMTSLDGTIISANELFCQVSGYTEKEIIGRNESIVNSGYHTQEFWEDFWHTITNRKVWRGDIRNKAKDGSYYWVDTTVFPLVNTENDLYGFMSVRHICTDQKEAAIRIAESELRFRTLADTAPVLVWMSDTEKLITYFNKTWLDFTGRTIEQDTGYGWADIIHPDDIGKCMQVYTEAFEARQQLSIEYRILHHSGEYRWLLSIGTPRYLPNGEFAGYMGSCVDITQRKEAEKYLLDVNEGLERRVEDRTKSLIKLNQEKNEFLGIAAHDLKNPLAGIRSSAEILLRYYIQEERAAKFIQNIIVSVDQMLDIVTNLLDVNKIESGGYEVHIRRIP
ncbi:MAG: PAS domain S-box protein [Ignavibacteria bacterium]|nr:PAS domain S-box protein [Ignavibacteria bacterium]